MISPSDYENLRSVFRSDQQCSYVAIDTERWEQSKSSDPKLIELGWSKILPASIEPSKKQQCSHFIIAENSHLKNYRYVPDERGAFAFGSTTSGKLKELEEDTGRLTNGNASRTASLTQVSATLSRVVKYLASLGSVICLFHDARGDRRELAAIGVDTSGWSTRSVPSSLPFGSIWIVDTRLLFARIQGRENGYGGSLKHLTEVLDISTHRGPFHNAANDAYYTLKSFVGIVSGPPLRQMQDRYDTFTKNAKSYRSYRFH